MDTAARGSGANLAARLRRWLPGLARGRTPEPLPIRLDRRRIYIVPTRAGLGFAVLLAAMLTGALNYQNNAALLLTCMLGATLACSMLLTWRELHDLTLRSLHADHGFCDARLPLHLAFADDGRNRPGLHIALDEIQQPCPLRRGTSRTTLTVPTERRGWMALPRMRLSSTLPFGMFRAWSWITPDQHVLVYPRALHDTPPRARHDNPNERSAGGDEFAGLRDYHPGDPIRHVAWKASARHEHLLVRQFDHAAPGQPLRFDWNALSGVDRETRIARLTGWVCDAYAQAHPWILILEDRRSFGPASDAAHYHRCLTALAELP
ncbi:MAG TPA: DUF58 domain-containing protein [Rhodanobacteraceae bacterium]|nr:DUF58 domain-containing protein [Rhodanobacteraceae bacterium]